MLGIVLYAYGEGNRVFVEQPQIVKGDLLVNENIVKIYARLIDGNLFKLTELRAGYGPIFGCKPAALAAEIPRRGKGYNFCAVYIYRYVRRPFIIVINCVGADLERKAYPLSCFAVLLR